MKQQSPMSVRAATLVGFGLVAALAVPAVPARAQAAKPAKPTLESLAARVKYFEDKEEITNVLINYGRALDSRDFKTYSSLFTKDGSWSGGTGSVTGGPQAIYDFMTKNLGGGRAGGTPRPIGFGPSYHIMSSFKIDINGDTATASSRWAFVTAALGPGIQVAGRYEDTLVREDGVWKIKSRQAFNDLPAKPAAASASAGAPAPPAPR
jgi:hypothetical protein